MTDFDDDPTPTVANRLAAEHAIADIIELADIEAEEMAEAEDLAVSGPTDGELEKTPTPKLKDPCRECRTNPLLRVAKFIPPPMNSGEAWGYGRCVATVEDRWAWCHATGILRLNWERRFVRDPSRDPGQERRRRP